MDLSKLETALEFAKKHNLETITVDGIVIHVPKIVTPQENISEDTMKVHYSSFPEFTEEEILFFSTEYFDELQHKKQQKLEAEKEKEDLNG